MRSSLIAVIAAIVCVLTLGGQLPGASAVPSRAARCSVSTGGPVIKYPTIYSFGRFCNLTTMTAPATVLLQGRIGGKWKTVIGVRKQLHMIAGKTYVVRTPAAHCTDTTQSIQMRTYVKLRTGRGRGHTYALYNAGIPATCISP